MRAVREGDIREDVEKPKEEGFCFKKSMGKTKKKKNRRERGVVKEQEREHSGDVWRRRRAPKFSSQWSPTCMITVTPMFISIYHFLFMHG